jgi:hypothetical protein
MRKIRRIVREDGWRQLRHVARKGRIWDGKLLKKKLQKEEDWNFGCWSYMECKTNKHRKRSKKLEEHGGSEELGEVAKYEEIGWGGGELQ